MSRASSNAVAAVEGTEGRAQLAKQIGQFIRRGSRVYLLFVVVVMLLWSALELFFGDVCWHPFHCVLSFTVCSCLVNFVETRG